MTSKTHCALGITTGLLILYFFPYLHLSSYVIISANAIGSLLPDIDTKKSDLSQLLPPLNAIIDPITVHRGFTHKWLPFILIALWFYFHSLPLLMIGIGALSHSLIDWITKMLHIKCQSKGEEVLFNALWGVNIVTSIVLMFK